MVDVAFFSLRNIHGASRLKVTLIYHEIIKAKESTDDLTSGGLLSACFFKPNLWRAKTLSKFEITIAQGIWGNVID